MPPFRSEDGTSIGVLRRFRFGMEGSSFFLGREPKVNSMSKKLRFQQGPNLSTVFKKEICTSMVTTASRSGEPWR